MTPDMSGLAKTLCDTAANLPHEQKGQALEGAGP